MPKESFEQFVERQKKRLKEAKKMVEEVKERWKDKIEEFEIEKSVEKSVKELKKLWEENEEEARKKKNRNEFFSFLSSLNFPEIPSFLLEKVSNKFLKEFDLKRFEKGYLDAGLFLGFFLSAFLKRSIEKNYILSQKEKDIKEEDIEPIKVHLDIRKLPICFDYLGYRNPKRLCLVIKGNCGWGIGSEMEGGEIVIKGNCGSFTGSGMEDGKIIVKGNCEDWTGCKMKGGEVIVEGGCGYWTGYKMRGGKLIVKGKVKFDETTFCQNQGGIIIIRKTKIWEKGNWTKQGMKMRVRGEIPMRRVC